jgi:epsilon-lactone hydrolase
MASPQAEAVRQQYRAMRERPVDRKPTVEESRAAAERIADGTAEPVGVRFDGVDAGGVGAEWVTPEASAADRVLLFVHGGGYCYCSMRSHSKLVGHLAKASGCRGLNVDYRLAPEHPHPAALDDTVTAYQWLLDQGIEAPNIAIAGDSAGGGLTAAALRCSCRRGSTSSSRVTA